MTPIVSKSLAIASLLACALATSAHAATRPQYGGTLHLELQAAPAEYAPEILATREPPSEELTALIFDRLVCLNGNGEPAPQLATQWEHDSTVTHWVFTLRQHVHLQNGIGLSPAMVMSALALQNAQWRVRFNADKLVIDTQQPQPGLLYELALPRNAIVVRSGKGAVIGSGPFRLQDWTPHKHATLRAFDQYWGGRPYVDVIELALGRAPADQLADFAAGKAQVIEASPGSTAELQRQKLSAQVVPQLQLLALAFDPRSNAVEAMPVRRAIALPLDRTAIAKQMPLTWLTPTLALLPPWLQSGAPLSTETVTTVTATAPIAPASDADLRAARADLQTYLRASSLGTIPAGGQPPAPTLTLAYDGTDLTSRAVAVQLQASAKLFGIKLALSAEEPGSAPGAAPGSAPGTASGSASGSVATASSDAPPDMRLRYFRVASPDCATALLELASRISPEALAATRKSVSATNALPAAEQHTGLARIATDRTSELWLVPIAFAPLIRVFDDHIANRDTSALDTLHIEELWLHLSQ